MIEVVLVEPEGKQNIGAVARAMMNMKANRLILVNPRCDHLSDESLTYAVHAKSLLTSALIYPTLRQALEGSELKIALSRRKGQWRKRDLTLFELGKFLLEYSERRVSLVFGREQNGLTNEEVRLCDIMVSIPASPQFPSLNLSHAVILTLYEIFRARELNFKPSKSELSSREDFDLMMKQIMRTLSDLGFFKNVPDWRLKSYLTKIFIRARLDNYDTRAIGNIFQRIDGIFKGLIKLVPSKTQISGLPPFFNDKD